jgi:hypothetical protein
VPKSRDRFLDPPSASDFALLRPHLKPLDLPRGAILFGAEERLSPASSQQRRRLAGRRVWGRSRAPRQRQRFKLERHAAGRDSPECRRRRLPTSETTDIAPLVADIIKESGAVSLRQIADGLNQLSAATRHSANSARDRP